MFTRDSVIISHNIKTPLTSISRAVGNILQLTYGQLVKSLFANGEQGFFYDPNDLSTMYQDAVGTVPVTSVGQPVGLIRDKSGRNNHARQTTSASRPILRQNAVTGAYYLEFDGSDDFLVTNSINFTSTDKVSLFAGVRKLNDATAQMIVELSPININNGMFSLLKGGGSTEYLQSFLRGTVGVYTSTNSPELVAPSNIISTSLLDISGATKQVLRANGSTKATSIASVGTGNYGNYPLYIGRRGGTTLPFNGHIYSLIGIGKLVSDKETVVIEKELAKRLGVTLNV